MKKYKWYAVWRYDNTKCLHIYDGDAESGMCEPVSIVADEPTYFRTKEACRRWARDGWFRGTWIIKKKEEA